jgi:hypothetical protein
MTGDYVDLVATRREICSGKLPTSQVARYGDQPIASIHSGVELGEIVGTFEPLHNGTGRKAAEYGDFYDAAPKVFVGPA